MQPFTEEKVAKFTEVSELVSSEFKVTDSCLAFGVPTFVVEGPTKEPFKRMVFKMREKGFVPFLRREGEKLIIKVFIGFPTREFKSLYAILLFVAVILSVSLVGYFYWVNNFVSIVRHVYPEATMNPFFLTFLFTASLMFILGIHEMGHKVAARIDGIESSPPFFLPGPPPLGTFGAVIMQKSPPVNRDQLVDMGASGILLGFITTVMITMIGFQLSVPIQPMPGLQEMPAPLLFDLFSTTVELPPNFVLLASPVLIAAYWGAFLTFLNVLPVWQLDGGHVSRALFGQRGHYIASLLSILLLFILGWPSIAFILTLLLLFAGGPVHPGALDEVSPLSSSRKLIALSLVFVAILCMVIVTPPV
jgi:Zn-dependent protease